MSDQSIPLCLVSGWMGADVQTFTSAMTEVWQRKRQQPCLSIVDDGVSDLPEAILDACGEFPAVPMVWVESAAMLEPMAVAELFALPPDDRFSVLAAVTVVDAGQLFKTIRDAKPLTEFDLEYDDLDLRTNADVVLEQVEFANVLVLCGLHTLSATERARTLALVEWLNPDARWHEVPASGYDDALTDSILRSLESSDFDFEVMEEAVGWLRVLDGEPPQSAQVADFIGFGFRARRPFHPTRFAELITRFKTDPEIVRIKGWIWIASRHDELGVWSLSGSSSQLLAGGAWMAATPMREWPEDPAERDAIMEQWEQPYGDRRQEFAIMGFALNEMQLRRELKACLLTDEELGAGPAAWSRWSDPLPDWSGDPIDNAPDEIH